MDNQQERPLSLDFLAGLIVGEGCFCLAVNRIAKRKGALRITPQVLVYMKDRETIMAAAEALKYHGLPAYIAERPKAGEQIGFQATGYKRVKRYCDTFIPLMTGQKKRAAILVSEFVESRLSTPSTGGRGISKPYTDREIQIVHELRATNGNTRGKKTPLESSEAIRRTPVLTG